MRAWKGSDCRKGALNGIFEMLNSLVVLECHDSSEIDEILHDGRGRDLFLDLDELTKRVEERSASTRRVIGVEDPGDTTIHRSFFLRFIHYLIRERHVFTLSSFISFVGNLHLVSNSFNVSLIVKSIKSFHISETRRSNDAHLGDGVSELSTVSRTLGIVEGRKPLGNSLDDIFVLRQDGRSSGLGSSDDLVCRRRFNVRIEFNVEHFRDILRRSSIFIFSTSTNDSTLLTSVVGRSLRFRSRFRLLRRSSRGLRRGEDDRSGGFAWRESAEARVGR